MKPVHVFNVIPSLPAALEGLRQLAFNLRWAWNHDSIELFRRLDTDLWESTGHNPVLMLGTIDQAQLEAAAKDDSFLAQLDRLVKEMASYLSTESTWYRRTYDRTDGLLVAYFSAEFGLTECLNIFAGGLGVLAGDHLKSASNLGVPLVGVGLLYQQGYFRQYLNAAGWQQESYEDNDFQTLPLTRTAVTVEVAYPGRPVTAQVWRVQVGRVSLFLLDSNLPANHPEDRVITDQLYGGDLEMRLKQEILLGIGGYRALEALGLDPTVYHMNEGHSAFLGLERVRRLKEKHGLSFQEAFEEASAGLIFTGHTPVPAGHDYFPASLMDRYFGDYIGRLGIGRGEFLALGRQNPANDAEEFCMTVLALRMAASSNGVSKLHGEVSRKMWKSIWPGVPEDEVPIGHVTNGVHFRSWISLEMNQLYDRYLGPNWRVDADAKLWQRVEGIPAEELWRTHERRRVRLVAFARRHLRLQLQRRGAPRSEIDAADEVLDPDALTIGFARRFATYKRATLVLRDIERLGRILNNAERPVQILFAGKAHPRDDAGKQLIQQIIRLAQQKEFRRRIVFLEDYDMAMARCLVQGSDIWLNTPLRPQEASGTSGMKALRQRRHQSEHPGWLVGRSLAGGGCRESVCGVGHRTRRELRQRRVPGPGGVGRPLRLAGTRYRSRFLRSGGRWRAAALDRQHEKFHLPFVSVIQHAACGQAIRRRLLCGGAREIPTVDGGELGARQGAGGLGFAHTGELGPGPRRAHRRAGGHSTGRRQPDPGPGVGPARGNSHR